MIKNKRILVLAPHTDDAELGCGGSVDRLVSSNEVFSLAFSSCKQSVHEGYPENVLQQEFQNANKVLGVLERNVLLFDYDVRTFADHRQNILEDLIKVRKEISPEIVLLPSLNDVHQDHKIIAEEAIRAFKNCCLLGYELPWNNFSFSPNFFIGLETGNIEKKCEAIACYTSQKHRAYTDGEFTRSLAKVRGVQSGQPLAEAFETIRWMI